MAIEFKSSEEFTGDFDARPTKDGKVKIGIEMFHDYLDYDLSREQALELCRYLSKHFEFTIHE